MSVVTALNDAKEVFAEFFTDINNIDLKKIAKAWGVKIYFEFLDGDVAGILFVSNLKTMIMVNASDLKVRQTFTIAHELGHYHLHKPSGVHVDTGFVMSRNTKSRLGEDIQEIEATQFAAELLMPEELLKKDVKEFTNALNDNDIDKLAKRYSVSEQAMTHRLISLKMV